MMLNYVPQFRSVAGKVVLGAHRVYDDPQQYETSSPAGVQHQVAAHMQLIRQMGFNAVRLCIDRLKRDAKGWYYPADTTQLYLRGHEQRLMAALADYVQVADSLGLRIMLLLPPPHFSDTLSQYARRLLHRFRNEPAVFAYDFKNEPLYNNPAEIHSKADALRLVRRWRSMMNRYAPHQLMTIGFVEPFEVFRWDPALLPVDFVAFHAYDPLHAANAIYWYAQNLEKPWIIGETGRIGDQDSVSYKAQANYLRATYQQALRCGGQGYGWWEYQEAPGYPMLAHYAGLLNHQDTTWAPNGYPILGTPKPAASAMQALSGTNPPGACYQPPNYYNAKGRQGYVLRGRVIDSATDEPIQGAVLKGWDADWQTAGATITQADGSFALYSHTPVEHLRLSAPAKTMLHIDTTLNYRFMGGDLLLSIPRLTFNHQAQEVRVRQLRGRPVSGAAPGTPERFFDIPGEPLEVAFFEARIGTLALRPLQAEAME
jgi:hypothetical protein